MITVMRSTLPRRDVLAAWAVFLALAAVVLAVHAVVAPWPVDPQTPLPTPRWAHHRLPPPPPLDVADHDAADQAAEFDDEMIMFGELPQRPSASRRSEDVSPL